MGKSDKMALTEELLPELECQNCSTYARPPIFLCETGHVICSTCNKMSTSCRNCAAKLIGTTSIPLNNLAKKILYPCDYHERGCKEIFSDDKIQVHLEECQFRTYKCPFAITAYKCSFEGFLSEMENHINEKHPKANSSRKVPQVHATTLNNVDVLSVWFQALYLDGNLFFRYTEKTEQFLNICILYVGPKTRRFKYAVTMETSNGEDSATMNFLTHPVETDVRELFNNGDGPSFQMAFVKRCLVKDQNLPIKVGITNESSKK
ncbi:hypothetical protein C0J52_25947 [Blattella germanica]|nr:hypothetical protein C0J52_25947 [Blattella germanica]